uniref:paired immunoglobulin-like type 2 receptor alpha n=1 Tax=Jaculus jaculus TaxID=51337 RepID=UPI001E1B3FE3|nr:paired immunoglobulin-like type 2 receptor alpha [Jaculus jaculus]
MVLLLLLLLLPPASLQAGNDSRSSQRNVYGMDQPKHMSGRQGGFVEIPFSFYHPWELASDPRMTIMWRWKNFHGPFIYNSALSFIHEQFKNRLVLNWTQGQTSGSLRILNLRKEDESTYFCRVRLNTRSARQEVWQSIDGTRLTITHDEKTTVQSTQTPTCSVTTAAREVTTEGQEGGGPWPLSPGAVAGVAVAVAVLVTGILALLLVLKWKRKKGRQAKPDTPAAELSRNTGQYDNIGHKGQDQNPKHKPKDDGVVYASLALSTSSSTGQPPSTPAHGTPQEDTVYSVVKGK